MLCCLSFLFAISLLNVFSNFNKCWLGNMHQIFLFCFAGMLRQMRDNHTSFVSWLPKQIYKFSWCQIKQLSKASPPGPPARLQPMGPSRPSSWTHLGLQSSAEISDLCYWTLIYIFFLSTGRYWYNSSCLNLMLVVGLYCTSGEQCVPWTSCCHYRCIPLSLPYSTCITNPEIYGWKLILEELS